MFFSVTVNISSGKELYARNAGRPGLFLAHKIKFEHVHLINFSKMRVDLAAEVIYSIIIMLLV